MQFQNGTTTDKFASLSHAPTRNPGRMSDFMTQLPRIGHQLALVDLGGSWTYGQLDNVTADIESWLIYLGIRAGDRVMLVSANCRAFVAILLALAHIDACPVVVDANLSTQEVDQLQAECHPRRVFYMISASQHAEAHALRHHATRLDPVDWGPIAISALNDSAKPVI